MGIRKSLPTLLEEAKKAAAQEEASITH